MFLPFTYMMYLFLLYLSQHCQSLLYLGVQVCFNKPSMATSLIVFLASDGVSANDQSKPTVAVHLNDISGHSHFLGECASNVVNHCKDCYLLIATLSFFYCLLLHNKVSPIKFGLAGN